MHYLQSGIKCIPDNSWNKNEIRQITEELTRGLQDHTKTPMEAYSIVRTKYPDVNLNCDMADQAYRLDGIVKSKDAQEWQKKLKISESNISEIISKTSILHDIVGEPSLLDRLKSLKSPSCPITRYPELQVRLCGAMKETVDQRIIEAVKSLKNFRITAKNPFTNNAPYNRLTSLPVEMQGNILGHISASNHFSLPNGTPGIIFERMTEGLTYGDSYDFK